MRTLVHATALSALLGSVYSYVVFPQAFAEIEVEAHAESQVRVQRQKCHKVENGHKNIQKYQILADVSPTAPDDNNDDDDDTPLPVVIWHGLGDSSTADGIKDVASLIDTIHPGTYVYIIQLGTDGNADRTASFIGNVTEQVESVCDLLAADPILSTAPAIDAVGFSQGGQFLRAYIEKCNAPKVRNLITFGSQHNGIREFQKCKSAFDVVCQAASALLRSGGVWSAYVQSRLVPAQYYRDPEDLGQYLENSAWLADVNNERDVKNATYKANLAMLEKFVMVLFKDDETVIPRESGWFAEVDVTNEKITQLRDRRIYKEDWIGLKTLDEKGGLVFEEVDGGHMQLKEKDLKRLFGKYFGPLKENGKKVIEEQWNMEL